MKNTSLHIIFITILFLPGAGYAAIDSLPACITTKKIAAESSVTEYDYKGQRWFVFTKLVPPAEQNVSDKMTTIQFYDTTCKIVCWWTTGGIAAINRVLPDSIDKNKIKKLEQQVNNSQHLRDTTLPAPIKQLAIQLNARYVQLYHYKEEPVYFLAVFHLPANELAQKGVSTIEENYYTPDGKWLATFRRATNGMFMRSQHWEPSFFTPSKMVATKTNWQKKGDTFLLDLQFLPAYR